MDLYFYQNKSNSLSPKAVRIVGRWPQGNNVKIIWWDNKLGKLHSYINPKNLQPIKQLTKDQFKKFARIATPLEIIELKKLL